MSHDELAKITKRLDEHDLAHEKLAEQIDAISEQNKRQFQMLEPIYKIFTSVQGFNGITVWILKALILIGAGVGVVYGLVKYLKS